MQQHDSRNPVIGPPSSDRWRRYAEQQDANRRFAERMPFDPNEGLFVTLTWPDLELCARTANRRFGSIIRVLSRKVLRAHLHVVWAWGPHRERPAMHIHAIIQPFVGEGQVTLEDVQLAASWAGHRGEVHLKDVHEQSFQYLLDHSEKSRAFRGASYQDSRFEGIDYNVACPRAVRDCRRVRTPKNSCPYAPASWKAE